jgi:hypothetical protein
VAVAVVVEYHFLTKVVLLEKDSLLLLVIQFQVKVENYLFLIHQVKLFQIQD